MFFRESPLKRLNWDPTQITTINYVSIKCTYPKNVFIVIKVSIFCQGFRLSGFLYLSVFLDANYICRFMIHGSLVQDLRPVIGNCHAKIM